MSLPYKFNGGNPKRISYTIEEVFQKFKEDRIRFVDMQFTSLPGRFHHTTVSADVLTPEQMRDGLPKLDGSSIVGFASIEDSDLILKPDPNTYAYIPWLSDSSTRKGDSSTRIGDNKTARLICDVYWGQDRGRLSRDPRGIAQKAENYIKEQGYRSYWGPEVEFFVFDKIHWDVLTPYKGQSYSIESKEAPWSQEGTGYPMGLKHGYYPSTPSDTLTPFRNECVNILNTHFGILCDNHHHEVATAGQCEIDIMYDTLTNSADSAQSYKFIVRNVAQEFEKVATMMPKPISMDAGSGMHVNVSLWKGKENTFFDENDPEETQEHAREAYQEMENIFFDENDPEELSQTARYFCGGIMNHAKALSAICNPTTNSYHRLVPGYEAPAYIAWSSSNRSAIVRVPKHFMGKSHSKLKRLEFRAPDPSSNPYLVFAAVTAAGMDGIKNKTEPGDPVQEDIFKMDKKERRRRGIEMLPATLGEALDELESDNAFLRPIFTSDVIDMVISLGKRDHREISIRPHPHEFYLYFDV